MDKIRKLYLSILSHVVKKLILREFMIWQSKVVKKPTHEAKIAVDGIKKRKTHTYSSEKITKFKSLTEKSLKHLVEDLPELNVIPESNIFEELKSSLMNKALKNDAKSVKDEEKNKTMHKKNNFSTAHLYTNSGTRKKVLKNPEVLDELAVVSSYSAVNFRRDKNNPIFAAFKK